MAQHPTYVFSEQDARAIVADAVLAPSVQTTQPWRFVVDGDAIRVHVRRGWADSPSSTPTPGRRRTPVERPSSPRGGHSPRANR
ncbi:MAG: hypothetical protein M3Q27_09730 [Actinomycetota bacterium]|nr:hypothetical protein [Actinomycetota bacterium]